MRIEVLNTGSELLLGSAVNTHLAFLGERLFSLGLRIARQECVPDGAAIGDALRETFGRADVVIVTGGLGPTSDDLTRDLVAELLGRPLSPDERVLEHICEIYRRFGRPVSESIARQAQVPRGAQVLWNPHGTAPGLYVPAAPPEVAISPDAVAALITSAGSAHDPRAGIEAVTPPLLASATAAPHLFLLPGPPRELRPMVEAELLPRLRALRDAGRSGPPPEMRLFRVIGIGESQVEEMVGDRILTAHPSVEVGYCARSMEVDLRLIGPQAEVEAAAMLVRATPGLPEHIATETNESLEEVIVRLLRAQDRTLATAESCTGGLLAHRITNVPGASAVFLGGVTPYANAAKERLLGVPREILAAHGAVSAETAGAMASGARRLLGTDFALATTGLAGPGGGTEQKPVGTVFFALAGPREGDVVVKHRRFPHRDRETLKQLSTQAALDLLRRALAPRQ